MSFFTPDGTHYFPAGSPLGVLRGAEAIADCWVAVLPNWVPIGPLTI